jgi:hypothetical protein
MYLKDVLPESYKHVDQHGEQWHKGRRSGTYQHPIDYRLFNHDTNQSTYQEDQHSTRYQIQRQEGTGKEKDRIKVSIASLTLFRHI